jgi:16S rRNA (adenine1518-N6/adenine1519-N6)-dimethyltransferase
MRYPRAKKRLGQHFLHDPAVIQRIITTIAPQPDDRLVEIGGGRGALTRPLLEHVHHLDVVETDTQLIPVLRDLAPPERLNVHRTDALAFDFASLVPEHERLRVAGNLPYNISTPLLFRLLTFRHVISEMHLMLQKEVVDRMVAGPG